MPVARTLRPQCIAKCVATKFKITAFQLVLLRVKAATVKQQYQFSPSIQRTHTRYRILTISQDMRIEIAPI